MGRLQERKEPVKKAENSVFSYCYFEGLPKGTSTIKLSNALVVFVLKTIRLNSYLCVPVPPNRLRKNKYKIITIDYRGSIVCRQLFELILQKGLEDRRRSAENE